jgi:hypothetical protein
VSIQPPDVDAVLAGLKDFQRDSVDYTFRRFFLDPDPTDRFLVADEVGLGKTLVARGVIAKTLDHLWADKKRLDVIYVCSNAQIARQNLARLQVVEHDNRLLERITLLPQEVHNLRSNKVNFIALSPNTSLKMGSNPGRWRERALLYWMLQHSSWNIRNIPTLNVLQAGIQAKSTTWWRREVEFVPRTHALDKSLLNDFERALDRHVRAQKERGEIDLRTRFEDLCDQFKRHRTHIPADQNRERNAVIAELRQVLATSCVKALDPDLIILDEFQRFKDLLVPDSPEGELARGLFNYQDAEESKVKVLLLSATPYKMYTLSSEAALDDHYADFVRTLEFLLDHDPQKVAVIQRALDDYRGALLHLDDDSGALATAQGKIEKELRKVMIRTERLAVSEHRDGMLVQVPPAEAQTFTSEDAKSFVAMQRVADHLEHGSVMEYWKSAPYALSFMERYIMKKRFADAAKTARSGRELASVLQGTGASGILSGEDVEAYAKIDPGNARLRALFADMLDSDAWRLLWLPPALPYYRGSGSFASDVARRLTKRLVFSAWLMAPRAIAALTSYEVERRIQELSASTAKNTPEDRKKRAQPLLRFSRSKGRLTGMNVFAAMYPSVAMARLADPLGIGHDESGALRGEAEVIEAAEVMLSEAVAPLLEGAPDAGPEDESWYWAAPILLDLARDPDRAEAWWARDGWEFYGVWGSSAPGDDDDAESDAALDEHVERARALARGEIELGRPPKDLTRVLAQLALGAPATCALRALMRFVPTDATDEEVDHMVDSAGQIAWGFRTYFNQAETMALVRGLDDDSRYWQRVLAYSISGNIQAALDEYFHQLFELASFGTAVFTEQVDSVTSEIVDVLGMRTPTMFVDDITVAEGRVRIDKRGMRNRFALRYGAETGEDGSEATREDLVRAAFNSPFWPFVLASTSVGQEGLDFHRYCHAVVHWHLPPNPVDMEQREGRVHRYKGHAVRKNLAARHGPIILASESDGDPWQALIDAALEDDERSSDLTPYWIYTAPDGAKIERHVPSWPLSRDEQRLADLRRSLTIYRMAFGQPRQEDLIQYLLERYPRELIEKHLGGARIDLSPPPAR